MFENVKILDCTLRDGGYINNWEFGAFNSRQIISSLDLSGVNYIEIGFLVNHKTKDNQTLFCDFDKLSSFIPENTNKSKLT